MSEPDASTPLGEVRDFVTVRLEEGVRCPACDQHAQMYRWRLYGTALRALGLYWKLAGRPSPAHTARFVHTDELKAEGHTGQGDATRLALWGLAERAPERRPDGGKSGLARITPLGVRFLLRRATVARVVVVYNAERVRFEGEQVHIDECGRNFNYAEMMRGLGEYPEAA
jgi:hypothetical protein